MLVLLRRPHLPLGRGRQQLERLDRIVLRADRQECRSVVLPAANE